MGLGTIIKRALGMPAEQDQELPAGKRGPAPYPTTDDADPIKYAAYSRQLLDEQRQIMQPLFVTWTQNILFLAGLQWWKFDPMTGGFVLPRLPEWKERPVRNMLLPFFKTFLGKVTKNRPATVCVPGSTEPEAIEAAKLGDEVLEAKWLERKMPDVLRRAIAWLFVTGNVYIMPFWNRDAGILHPLTARVTAAKHDEQGNPVMQPGQPQTDELGNPVADGMGNPMMGPDQQVMEPVDCPCDENGDPIMDDQGNYDLEAQPAVIDLGEIDYRVFSPFQVFVDAAAESDQDLSYMIVAEPMPIRDVYRRWPQVDSVPAEDTSQVDRFAYMVNIFATGADTHIAASQTKRDQMIPRALVLHYFEKPCQEWPGGRHWVTVSDQLLEAPGPLPDAIWPPMRRLKDVEVPGRYHAEATMTAGVGPQREYNELCAQIREHNNLMGRGKWLVPRGSGVKRGQITNQPGEVIQHTQGLPPVPAQLPQIPQSIYTERDRALTDLQTVLGMHQTSMGQAPPGVTSGRAFLTLQEADDTDLGPFIGVLEETVAELGWDSIRIIQQRYTEERLLQVSGKDNSFRVKSFKGEDLSGIAAVKPQAGSAIPWSASAKQSMMIELAQQFPGLFTDPETGQFDAERFRQLLPLGGAEALDLSSDLDAAEARREEEYYKAWDGMEPLPQPQPWQNHRVHLRTHANVLKSAAFFEWPQQAQEAFVQHWLATMTLLQVQGQPAQPGQPPVPGQQPSAPAGVGVPPGAGADQGSGQDAPPEPATEGAPAQVQAAQQDVDHVRDSLTV